MEIYKIMDFSEYREKFGVQKKGNKFVSKNRILKSFITSDEVREYCKSKSAEHFFQIDSMPKLWEVCYRSVISTTIYNSGIVKLMDESYRSPDYKTDEYNGICMDRTFGSIRYARLDNGKVYKMKAGKMYKHLILNSRFGKVLPESVVLWMCEEFTRKWEAYTMVCLPSFTLHVDDNFCKIYDRYGDCKGDFGSCMRGGHHADFYTESVKAKAAYLTDDADDGIIARCVIFTDVRDENTGEILRLAERQYSSDGNETLKRCLVEALIKAGEIDGYKKVGAGCCEADAFVLNNGDSLSGRELSIRCTLSEGDTLSYQDSFKWYDENEGRAYNYDALYAYGELDSTNDKYWPNGEQNWDEWNECYTDNNLQTVYYHGRAYQIDEYEMDEFVWVESEQEYHHEDEVSYCEECGEHYLVENEVYSEITGDYYCCECCKEEAEKRYIERNWHYSYYDKRYFEDENDVTGYFVWSDYSNIYVSETISLASLHKLIDRDDVILCGGEYYENVA